MELLTDPRISKAKYFVSVDIAGGYFAVPVKEEDQDKLTIVSPYVTYENFFGCLLDQRMCVVHMHI